MGRYINKGNNAFRDIVNSEYVDKTSLIPFINSTLNTERRYSCVTRCRRFGKSMAAKMLCAYYDIKNNYYEYEVPVKLTPAIQGGVFYNNNSQSDRYIVWPEQNL